VTLTLGNEFGSFADCCLGIDFLNLEASMNGVNGSPISRREFARRAAMVSAASLVPATALPVHAANPESPLEQSADSHSSSPEHQAEAEARYQAILGVYASRFSETQRADLRRLCFAAQEPLDRLRAYPVENGDGPALYLKPLVEREKKPGTATSPRLAGQAAKNP
jgi:hypothetical protein